MSLFDDGPIDYYDIEDSFSSGLEATESLNELDVQLSYGQDSIVAEIARGLKRNKTIQRLRLDCPNDPSMLITALKDNRHLRSISLSIRWPSNAELSPEACEVMANLIQANDSKLESVEFSYLPGRGLATIFNAVKSSTTLKEFILDGMTLEGEDADRLLDMIEMMNSTLEVLRLNLFILSDRVRQEFAPIISQNRSLRILSLSGNSITNEFVQVFSGALQYNRTLQELSLSSHDIGVIGIGALSCALTMNTTLQKLHLFANLGDIGALALVGALHNNSTLRQLDLNRCMIGRIGLRSFASLTRYHPTLERLILTCTRTDSDTDIDTLRHVATAANKNPTLTFLALRYYEHSQEKEQILELLKEEILSTNVHLESFSLAEADFFNAIRVNHLEHFNRGGRKILLEENVPLALWPWILERANTILYYNGDGYEPNSPKPQLSVLYSLLRQGPLLLGKSTFNLDDRGSGTRARKRKGNYVNGAL